MGFRHFRFQIVMRLLLLCATLILFLYLLRRTDLILNMVVIGILFIYQIVAFIRYVEAGNRKMVRFLEAITYSDFSQNFEVSQGGGSFQELNEAFNNVMSKIQQTRAEKEEHHRYLQTVVQNIGIGLIIFREDGQISLINNAAKRLLNIRRAQMLENLSLAHRELPRRLREAQSGKQFLMKLVRDDQLITFVMYATDFIQQEHQYRLITVQNIQSELEETEMEAMQNLIRVLTHEIMNSVTPIISLANTANSMLSGQQAVAQTDCGDWLPDVRDAIATIESRSESLLKFVENYRQLTRIPKPDFTIFPIQELMNRVMPLYENEHASRIQFNVDAKPPTLELTADQSLIEQVLINLLKNAIEAVEKTENPIIRITAGVNEWSRPWIQVEDNGTGIEPHVLQNIFIPFFTTKAQGSGIGLSLSRQIMRLHGGSLGVQSRPGKSTIFTMQF